MPTLRNQAIGALSRQSQPGRLQSPTVVARDVYRRETYNAFSGAGPAVKQQLQEDAGLGGR